MNDQDTNVAVTTHSEECWKYHRACAIREVERLRAEVESYRRSPDGEARQVVAATIKKLTDERDYWKQRAESAWAQGDLDGGLIWRQSATLLIIKRIVNDNLPRRERLRRIKAVLDEQ